MRALAASLVTAVISLSAHCAEPTAIGDKTLVAWVTPADLTQRGGSVLTIEKEGGVFDAVVFGEVEPARLFFSGKTCSVKS